MEGYFYSINKNLFSFSFVNETNERHDRWEDRHNWSHYPILHRVLNFMEDRGFEVGRDPRIEKHYKCLNKDHWYGKKDNLEFKAERYPRGFSIKFFQNINFENKSGGEYDFYKFDKAPYLIKLMWINETYKIGKFIKKIVPDVVENSKKIYKLSEDKIKNHFVESWHHTQNDMNFNLSDLDGITCEETYNNKDRDGKTIYNGEIKYFRDYKGRLNRGKVYHNINNMWWIILNDTDYTNEACFSLFDATEEDFKHRRIQKSRKKSYETSRVVARKNFTNKFTYKDITRKDIEQLHELVGIEIEKATNKGEAIETMKINPKIRTRCTSNKKIKHAFLYVDAHYFEKRECISFNADGFIGFAGWASDANVRPILKGFNRWCSYLSENK
ncbi:hypothetical protein CF088_13975 [Clostridium botulinum]|uniref:hypothetical protein n=1 Tax=Clostridium botulinum TaxID=1491 RepID=UPI000774DA00|nr:hypothetical protein [Clostridium botulinum]MBN3406370.1 hypothetical protein [Clostridium botulinum]NEZ84390.1 hypothetical protein [Clostridium botulinum]NFA07501.1 hypothetical protein [Clostridium botulinum]NFA26026.1 hypothetical protein [Clostridium botulinum]NFB80869.1 hypothetical protein [Clostridium botulinum]